MGAVHSQRRVRYLSSVFLNCPFNVLHSKFDPLALLDKWQKLAAPSLDSGEDGSNGLYLPNSCTDQWYQKSTSYPRSITYSTSSKPVSTSAWKITRYCLWVASIILHWSQNHNYIYQLLIPIEGCPGFIFEIATHTRRETKVMWQSSSRLVPGLSNIWPVSCWYIDSSGITYGSRP